MGGGGEGGEDGEERMGRGGWGGGDGEGRMGRGGWGEVNKWKAMQYRGRRREGSEEFLIEYYLLVHVLASSSTSA